MVRLRASPEYLFGASGWNLRVDLCGSSSFGGILTLLV